MVTMAADEGLHPFIAELGKTGSVAALVRVTVA